jgi:hypothetical protein
VAAASLFTILTPCSASAKERSDKTEAQQIEQLRAMVLQLQNRVDGLERQLNETRAINTAGAPAMAAPELTGLSVALHGPTATPSDAPEVATNVRLAAVQPVRPQTELPSPQPQATPASPLASVLPSTLPGGATLNYFFDGYYEFNFNQPPGRVNYLRAYDVLSHVFSIGQADLVTRFVQRKIAGIEGVDGNLQVQLRRRLRCVSRVPHRLE